MFQDRIGAVVLLNGSILADYGSECKSKVLLKEYALECARYAGADVWLDGNGIIGAIPYVAMPDRSVALSETNVPDEICKTDPMSPGAKENCLKIK